MSRLESMRRRLSAQIDGLNWAAHDTSGREGDVVEIGLGNGRTYDHLRETLPNRRIWVIDRQMNAHQSCVPPDADFLLGDADAMLSGMIADGTRIVFAHYDLSKGVPEADAELAAEIAPLLVKLVVPGGVVVSGQPLPLPTRIEGPGLEDPDRYFFYRM